MDDNSGTLASLLGLADAKAGPPKNRIGPDMTDAQHAFVHWAAARHGRVIRTLDDGAMAEGDRLTSRGKPFWVKLMKLGLFDHLPPAIYTLNDKGKAYVRDYPLHVSAPEGSIRTGRVAPHPGAE